MKKRLLFPLAGLAISLALPIFGQQTSKPDPQLRQKLVAFLKKFDEAYNNNNAAVVAANFTEDADLVTPYGRFSGRSIEQWYAALFRDVQSSNNLFTADEDSPHIIGTDGKEMWATGAWSATVKGQSGSLEVKGYWSAINILEGDDWKIRMLCNNVTPPPAAPASPSASPSGQ